MDPVTAAIVVGGSQLLGNVLTNQANASMADKQMEFQQRNSDSAHQREVADLSAAGLNPLLSARYGGASTPQGAMAPQYNPMSGVSSAFSESYRAGLEGQRNPAQIDLMRTQADVNQQQAIKIASEAENLDADTQKKLFEVAKVLPSQDWLNRASAAERDSAAAKFMSEVTRLIPSQVKMNESSSKHYDMVVEGLRAKLRGLLVEERIDTTAWAGLWRYVARMVKGTFGSILNFGE